MLGCFCQKKAEDQKTVAVIGGKAVVESQLESFSKMKRMYPTRIDPIFTGNKSDITLLIETEVLSELGTDAVLSGNDWKWKKVFYPAQMFLTDILDKNMGYTDAEIEAYYKLHLKDFTSTVKVGAPKVDAAPGAKLNGMKDSIVAGRDTTIVKTLAEIRQQLLEKMFCEKNPPDAAFLAKRATTVTDSAAKKDTVALKREWFASVRNALPAFFMKKYYVAKFKKPMPDSISVWCGDGKFITKADIETILGWIPEQQRNFYKNDPQRYRELAEWLLKWKLFSEVAEQTKYTTTADIASIIEWARKLDRAADYVQKDLIPKAKKAAFVDPTMAWYAYWDEANRKTALSDTAGYNATYRRLMEKAVGYELDKVIYDVRKKKNVSFPQADYADDKGKNPAQIALQADTARDSGDSRKAESLYSILVTSFPFTEQGARAFGELAKIQTETEQYRTAVDNYRWALVSSKDASKRCNMFFMIGFIYDEYMNNPDLAEVNYKWVLKNSPDCELADDAEFMALHLDEPMNSVEELRGEAIRQGRKIDPSDTVAVEDAPDTTKKK